MKLGHSAYDLVEKFEREQRRRSTLWANAANAANAAAAGGAGGEVCSRGWAAELCGLLEAHLGIGPTTSKMLVVTTHLRYPHLGLLVDSCQVRRPRPLWSFDV